MPALQNGALRLVRVFGIDVFVHWSWLVVALIELQNRQQGRYAAAHWHVIEYLSLFGIVLVHEFGHALACRSVGGKADRIMLWPLGGVAYVSPPPRPGAVLWSIAAGPLVADQFRIARRVGFDEVELPDALAERQPEPQWHRPPRRSYQERLTG